MYHEVILIIILVVFAYKIGEAFVTGSVHLRGEKEPIRRQERPRDYWYAMGIISVVFAIIVAILAFMYLTPK